MLDTGRSSRKPSVTEDDVATCEADGFLLC